jgi:hypothetical protein
MEYRQFAVPMDLRPWIECLWTLRGTVAGGGQAILPDGRMEMVFHFGDPPLNACGSRQPRAIVAGQIRSALTLLPNGAMDAMGVRLMPAAGGSMLPTNELAGRLHDLEGVEAKWARLTLETTGNAEDRVQALMASLRRLTARAARPDRIVVASADIIEAKRGRGAMGCFIPDGIGPRQWERRFSAAVGLTPKGFARIARLREAIRLFESGDWGSWAAVALECGFYDQAHLNYDFRGFTGQSPDRFFREGRAMAEFYRDGNFQDRAATPGLGF